MAPRKLAAARKEFIERGLEWEEWVQSEADEYAAFKGCIPDPAASERVREFFSKVLRHSDGEWAGRPFELLDWEWHGVIRPLYAWKRPDGRRRFRFVYASCAKKNGKSGLFSGLSLAGLTVDGVPAGEVYSAGADREQATIIYRGAANMVRASDSLATHIDIVDSRKRLVYLPTRAFYQALSADVPTKEGLKGYYVLFDELHAQKTRDLFDTLFFSTRASRNPIFACITTAGYDKHSICHEVYERCKRVQDGVIDDISVLTYIAEAPEECALDDGDAWMAANPSLGTILDREDFAQDAREAAESPTKENRFRRYRLNQWTEQDVRWIEMARWDACAKTIDAADLVGKPCTAGLDLAITKDLTALVLAFPDEEDFELIRFLPFFWAPEVGAKTRQQRDGVPYLDWAAQGLLELTEGDVTDYRLVERRICELAETYLFGLFAIDRKWQGVELCTRLKDDHGLSVFEFGQGYFSMSGPTEEFERRLLLGKLMHGGNPILRWMASNVSVKMGDEAGNIKPDKAKSGDRIDGIVAAIMALAMAMKEAPSAAPSIDWV